MEGTYTTAIVLCIATLVVTLLGWKTNKFTRLLAVLLCAGGVAIRYVPIFPHTPGSGTERMAVVLFTTAGMFIILASISFWFAHRYKFKPEDTLAAVVLGWILTMCVIGATTWGLQVIAPYPLYDGPTYATELKTEPTGAETILYENDRDIVLEKETGIGWKNVSTITTVDELVTNRPFRVAKNGESIDIPSVRDIEYIETSGLEVSKAYRTIATIRVTKVTLVERVHKEVLRVDLSHVIHQWTDNKIVMEYEITNVDEVKQHMSEDERQEQTKTQTKEELQQFVTPTKGD